MVRPPITIVMTTWAPEGDLGPLRVNACREAIASLQENLVYDGELGLHIADDGSQQGDWATSVDSEPATLWTRGPRSFSRQEAHGVGASINAGLRVAFLRSPLAFYTVDDWLLTAPLDLRPWAEAIVDDETIGLVLFGPPSANTYGMVFNRIKAGEFWTSPRPDPENWIYALRVSATLSVYGYTQRPALMHRRFSDCHGPMPEDCGAVSAEDLFNRRWKAAAVEDIVQAIEQCWRHLGASSELGIIHPPSRRR